MIFTSFRRYNEDFFKTQDSDKVAFVSMLQNFSVYLNEVGKIYLYLFTKLE